MKTKSILAGIALVAINLLNSQTWTVVGDPEMNGLIYTGTVDTTNKLYVAGSFSYGLTPNGKSYVARYNYMDWEDVGNFGGNGMIEKIINDAANNLYISGEFKNASNRYYIAKYDGSSWSQLGNLESQNKINDIVTDGTNVYASGIFVNTSNGQTYYIAKWNGSNWTQVDSGNFNGRITTLFVRNNSLYVAGEFTNSFGYYCVYRLNAGSWSEVGKLRSTYPVVKIVVDSVGKVYASHSYQNNGSASAVLSRYEPVSNTWIVLNLYYPNIKYIDATDQVYAMTICGTPCQGIMRKYTSQSTEYTDYFVQTNSGVSADLNAIMMDNFGYLLTSSRAAFGEMRFGLLKSSSVFLQSNEITVSKETQIFPNPTSGIFTLRAKDKINSAEIYDITGKLIKKLNPNSVSTEINITGQPKGVYLLKTDTGKKQETQKVILK